MSIFDIFKAKKRKINNGKRVKRVAREISFYSATHNKDYKTKTKSLYENGDHYGHVVFQHGIKGINEWCSSTAKDKEIFAVCPAKNLVLYIYAFYDGRSDKFGRKIRSFLVEKLTPAESERFTIQDFVYDIHQAKAALTASPPTGFDLADKFGVVWNSAEEKESFCKEFLARQNNAIEIEPFEEGSENQALNEAWQAAILGEAIILQLPKIDSCDQENEK